MREPPAGVADAAVLAVVRQHWPVAADRAEHLPAGFGAHHWTLSAAGTPTHVATLDALGHRHTAASLEAAYRTAVALAEHLDAVLAPLPARDGRCTVDLDGSALSLTPWSRGQNPPVLDPRATLAVLARLHAVPPPATTPRWRPLVPPDLAVRVQARCAVPWTGGPHGTAARAAVRPRLADLARWTARYHALGRQAAERPWVVTHGEPHEGNQLLEGDRLLLIDWESVALAPVERDLRTLRDRGHEVGADPAMVELFDLEWRLDEVDQYVRWLSGPHPGSASDAVALAGLRHELERPG